MIAIYVDHITPRLNYVLDFCFKEKDEEYQLFTEKSEFEKQIVPRLNYSERPISANHQIIPAKLLFEDFIRELNPVDENLKIDGIDDPLSLIFTMLTRYEEYLPSVRDGHDRWRAKSGILVKKGKHRIPFADILVKELWEKLGLDYSFVLKRFECVPSFDIDVAWAYKYRKFPRSVGSFLKGKDKRNRIKVALGKEKDPYDTYSYINEISTRVDRIICFSLLGDWGKFDKNIHWENEHYQSLIRGLNTSGGMGLHPSYNSYLNKDQIIKEKKRLEQIVGHEIVKSRQHFLKLKFPETYRTLLEAGIHKDYSMGFADDFGFRAGTSFPYLFFDLKKNRKEGLLIFPFVYMDSAMKDYLKLSSDEAIKEIETLVESVRSVGGLFMCIWHNSSVNDRGEWEGWRKVLDKTIELCS